MKTRFAFSFVMVSALLLSLNACRKKEEDDKDASAAGDNALAESMFNDLKSMADQAYSGFVTTYRDAQDTLVFGCATVIRDTVSSPRSIIVDFGTTNCQCNDGRNRRGKVMVTYTGGYRDPGTVITHTPQNYFVNDHQLTGSKTVTNMGRNSANNLYFNISVNGNVIKPNNGGTITWTSNRVREWIAGESTVLNWLDDEYLITGTASGTTATGQAFDVTVTSPLKIELDCRWITSGSFDLTPQGKLTRTVNYGTGGCDNQATLTIGSYTMTIFLN